MTTFKCGHPDTPENTYVYVRDGRVRFSGCKECRRENERRWRTARPEFNRQRRKAQRARERGVVHVPYGGLPAIFSRDGGKCAYCGDEVFLNVPNSNPKQATVDHCIPMIAGGPDTEENVVLACRYCNTRKKDKVDYAAS